MKFRSEVRFKELGVGRKNADFTLETMHFFAAINNMDQTTR